jgi:hypothetical protein
VTIFVFPVFTTAATAAPPLAAAAVEPSPATPTAPLAPPHPRASRGPPEFTVFALETPHRPLPCPTPVEAPPPSLPVARPLQLLSIIPETTIVTAVSSWSFSSRYFSCYRALPSSRRAP